MHELRAGWLGRRLLMLALLAASGAHSQNVAYLRSLQSPGAQESVAQGNAWLFHRGNQCYAVTPRHVLADPAEGRDDRYARLVVVRAGRPPAEAMGERCAVFKREDLAVLRVSGVEDLAECGEVFAGTADIDALLAQSQHASLLTAVKSGRFEYSNLGIRAVTASDPDHFWVAPEADRDRMTEGMSGGLVLIAGQMAGFLQSVSAETQGPTAGMAKVLKADYAAIMLNRLLDGSLSSDEEEGICTQPKASAATRESVENRASAGCGASILGWSAPAASSATFPDNLLGAKGPDGRWRASASGEVDIDVQLCPAANPAISTVRVDTNGCHAGDDDGVDLEALVRAQPGGPYVSLGYGAVPPSGTLDIHTGNPTIGRQVRLRFVPRDGRTHAVCAGGLMVR